ncbi:MAG: hypothetical protein EBS01_08970 [Verrucomicrobia bacterium]|nr:hypothetical protein [Verrucomicrobiota bacterium]
MEALESALNGAMSNVLKVSKQTTISELHAKGWSLRRIALELGLNRRTVAAYAKQKPKPVCDSSPNCTTEVTTGPAGEQAPSKGLKVWAKSSSVSAGKSLCRDHAAFITSRLEAGLSAESIHRELRDELKKRGRVFQSETDTEIFAHLISDEVKAAWRRLARTHHPDKLIAEGMPPEFVAIANERLARINDACTHADEQTIRETTSKIPGFGRRGSPGVIAPTL